MRNVKVEKNLIGPQWWKKVVIVTIPAASAATPFSASLTTEEKERIIQSWKTIAVFATKSTRPFQIGFIAGEDIWTLHHPIETSEGRFGLRIGGENLRCFAFDPTFQEEVSLSFVETVQEDDVRYRELPVY